ncbi:hypothetical protein B0I35DRAFT_444923 [Stachybotrys elegans]|uniref:Indole-diterpene biosynthesis protein PaxU n=1 Tax=Stachybotrys elegans TaxID=80388 RepID=A0A8K0SIA1_9HYPO|nr:hypothetical protein B0I35DRAFT_444923 [Stachybotrys elegans]
MKALRISPAASLYSPTNCTPQNAPKLIVLAPWIFAHESHIAKYVERYRALYPSASILVIRCFLRHLLWLPTGRAELAPAATTIRSILDGSKGQPKPQMLLHVFSNSGLGTAWQVNNLYGKDGADKDDTRLPLHATIFDSTPGRYDYWAVVSALLFGIPSGALLMRLVMVPLAHLLSLGIWTWCNVLGGEDWVLRWGQAANNPAQIRETCRSYAYGRADALVRAQWVEAHAAKATELGFRVVELADFGPESAHVAHSRSDAVRYWNLVAKTWDAALL